MRNALKKSREKFLGRSPTKICEKFVVWGPVAKVSGKKDRDPSWGGGAGKDAPFWGYTPPANKPTHTTN